MTRDVFELSPRPAAADVPTFLQTCQAIGYPEPPAWAVQPPASADSDALQNLRPRARQGGEGRG